jgi:uncharacterized protein YeeX (DUF496 family)
MDKTVAQFFPQPFDAASCDIFNCYSRAVWFVGRPDGPHNINLKLCKSCAESAIRNLPDELKKALVQEGMALLEIPEEIVETMEQAADELAENPGHVLVAFDPKDVKDALAAQAMKEEIVQLKDEVSAKNTELSVKNAEIARLKKEVSESRKQEKAKEQDAK